MHDLHVMPIGPQHPALKEPIYLKLILDGSTILDVDYNYGYIHRGVELIMEKKPLEKALFFVEHVCGICSYAHAGAFLNTIEPMFGIRLAERVEKQRSILAELGQSYAKHSDSMWVLRIERRAIPRLILTGQACRKTDTC